MSIRDLKSVTALLRDERVSQDHKKRAFVLWKKVRTSEGAKDAMEPGWRELAALDLCTGAKCACAGLKNRPDLNGQSGTLGPYDECAGRWVFLPANGASGIRVKSHNLVNPLWLKDGQCNGSVLVDGDMHSFRCEPDGSIRWHEALFDFAKTHQELRMTPPWQDDGHWEDGWNEEQPWQSDVEACSLLDSNEVPSGEISPPGTLWGIAVATSVNALRA